MEGIVHVEFSDWQKLDLRVSEIISVEDILGADKLYKIGLDAGEEIGKRIVCTGIKEHYSKEDLLGKKVIYFSNLKPRVLRGIESQGMLLAAVSYDDSGKEKEVVLITPEKEIGKGARIS